MAVVTAVVCLLIVGIVTPTQAASCNISFDDPSASGEPILANGSLADTRSCTPCNTAKFEVHVLSQKRSDARNVTVTIEAANNTDIKLLLGSAQATHWLIVKPSTISILGILLFGPGVPTVEVCGVTTRAASFPFPSLPDRLTRTAVNKYGFLTSYTWTEQVKAWDLNVGSCKAAYCTVGVCRSSRCRYGQVCKGCKVLNLYGGWKCVKEARLCPEDGRSKLNVAATIGGTVVARAVLTTICIISYICV